MKRLYIIPFLLVAFLIGCKEHLEIAPVSSITKESFFKTENDVQGALSGTYLRLRNLATAVNLYVWGEARSEMLTSSIAGNLGYNRYYDNSMTESITGPDWSGVYSAINSTNLVLKYTPGIGFTSEANKNNALAEAYTMRAYLYFILAKTWGGVPLRIEPTEGYDPLTIQLPKATEAEVFQLIKADLDKALQLFPNNSFPSGRNRWSKPAANALKADVYLWTGKRLNGGSADFTTALNAINEVETADVTLLSNFADIFKYTNKGNKEIIMAIRFQVGESSNQTAAHNMYSSSTAYPAYVPQWQRDIVGVPLAGNGNVWRITPLVRNQFTNDDTRKAATYVDLEGTGANQYYTNYGLKYSGTVEAGTRYFQNDYILYRYGDIVLMKAEAKNALNQAPTIEMNKIRLRAYGTANYPAHIFVPGTKAQNDDAILKERLFELALEGKRWWDLVRFGKAFDLVPSLQGRSAETHLLYWPIGVSTRTRETLVTEIEGWN
ncbi:MAG TPA: RagB/SusD family nutrient uptake outer membrane protein [Sphingobacteriaceae bacterium]